MAAIGSPPSSKSAPQAHGRPLLPATADPPTESNPPTPKVWLIFGATGHLGRAVTKAALTHGDSVAAVGRMMENSWQQMQGWHEQCLGLLCDVRVRETVQAVIEESIAHFGRVDVIVNCTGYGVIGACEDQDASDLRSQFETNFFGTLNIIQLSLPYFRERSQTVKDGESAGRYLIFSSTSGALGVPGLGPYCATKYAVEGLVESMLYEIDSFNIKATLVEPGHVRLDEPNGLDDKATESVIHDHHDADSGDAEVWKRKYGHFFVKPPSAPYAMPTAPAGHARRIVQWLQDRQPTSAVKSAELVWQLAHCRYPPLRLLLGSYAVESVRDRLKSIIEEIEDWKHLHFPAVEEAGTKGKGRESERDADREDESGIGQGEDDDMIDEDQQDGGDFQV